MGTTLQISDQINQKVQQKKIEYLVYRSKLDILCTLWLKIQSSSDFLPRQSARDDDVSPRPLLPAVIAPLEGPQVVTPFNCTMTLSPSQIHRIWFGHLLCLNSWFWIFLTEKGELTHAQQSLCKGSLITAVRFNNRNNATQLQLHSLLNIKMLITMDSIMVLVCLVAPATNVQLAVSHHNLCDGSTAGRRVVSIPNPNVHYPDEPNGWIWLYIGSIVQRTDKACSIF